jgi:glycosyltransferase involved in cell wall biosynthesis
MRIGVNARLLREPTLRGWNRYTVNLLAELPALGVESILYSDQPIHPDHLRRLPEGSYRVEVSPPMRYLAWEQRWLPRRCRIDKVELLHSPFNFGLPWSSHCPRILTLHDAIDSVYYVARASWKTVLTPAHLKSRLQLWYARTRAHRVITVSEHAKGDLVKHLGVPIDRVSVTHEAADPRFHRPVTEDERRRVRQTHKLERPYFFYVGGWEGRKNIPFLVRAMARARLGAVDLVLAGGSPSDRAALTQLAESLGMGPQLRLLNWVEDNDLPALYAEAIAFVYPSEYEGFGLQLCEAMAVGCPTIAARATCLPEVLGRGGETFELGATDELVQLLQRLHGDEEFRSELRHRALARSGEFSWRKTAEETVAVYELATR